VPAISKSNMLFSARVGDTLAAAGHSVMLYVPDYRYMCRGTGQVVNDVCSSSIDPASFIRANSTLQYMLVPAANHSEWNEVSDDDQAAYTKDTSMITGDGYASNNLFMRMMSSACKGV
jgi:hypothetical protein